MKCKALQLIIPVVILSTLMSALAAEMPPPPFFGQPAGPAATQAVVADAPSGLDLCVALGGDPDPAPKGTLVKSNPSPCRFSRLCWEMGGTWDASNQAAPCRLTAIENQVCTLLGGDYSEFRTPACLLKKELTHKDSYWSEWAGYMGEEGVSTQETWSSVHKTSNCSDGYWVPYLCDCPWCRTCWYWVCTWYYTACNGYYESTTRGYNGWSPGSYFVQHAAPVSQVCDKGYYVSGIECDYGPKDAKYDYPQSSYTQNIPYPTAGENNSGGPAKMSAWGSIPSGHRTCNPPSYLTRTWAYKDGGNAHSSWLAADRCRIRCSTEQHDPKSWWKDAFQDDRSKCKWTDWSFHETYGKSCRDAFGDTSYMAGLECDADGSLEFPDRDADKCRACCITETNPKYAKALTQIKDDGKDRCFWSSFSGHYDDAQDNPAYCPSGQYAAGINCDTQSPKDSDRCQILCCAAGELGTKAGAEPNKPTPEAIQVN